MFTEIENEFVAMIKKNRKSVNKECLVLGKYTYEKFFRFGLVVLLTTAVITIGLSVCALLLYIKTKNWLALYLETLSPFIMIGVSVMLLKFDKDHKKRFTKYHETNYNGLNEILHKHSIDCNEQISILISRYKDKLNENNNIVDKKYSNFGQVFFAVAGLVLPLFDAIVFKVETITGFSMLSIIITSFLVGMFMVIWYITKIINKQTYLKTINNLKIMIAFLDEISIKNIKA